jgi:hypothetical protein
MSAFEVKLAPEKAHRLAGDLTSTDEENPFFI